MSLYAVGKGKIIIVTNAYSRTNSTLDHYNEKLFHPPGLFYMIMKYEPRSLGVQDGNQQQSRSSPSQQFVSVIGSTEFIRKFRDPVSGELQGRDSLPMAVAPLVYHNSRHKNQDSESSEAVCQSGGNTSKRQWAKNTWASCNEYLDRRATARYVSFFLNTFPANIKTKYQRQLKIKATF